MTKILLLATGGTIASRESAQGLAPAIDARQILSHIPEAQTLCHLEALSLMHTDSTDMNPAGMAQIAKSVREYYDSYDGFVITHGTDTLAYSAAALSYMLRNLEKPVILTGSQLPLEAPCTDARRNLLDAVCFACAEIAGVFVAFDGILISGVHATKLKSKSMDAFQSVNFPVIAEIKHGKITYCQGYLLLPKTAGKFFAATKLCQNILVLKIFPGIGCEIFDFIREHYAGVIIESFGVGGIPGEKPDLVSKIPQLIEAGVAVVISTQCLYEGIDLDVYAVGKKLAREHVIFGADMTTEALTMKLMWALGNYDNLDDVKKCIETPYFADRKEESKKAPPVAPA